MGTYDDVFQKQTDPGNCTSRKVLNYSELKNVCPIFITNKLEQWRVQNLVFSRNNKNSPIPRDSDERKIQNRKI